MKSLVLFTCTLCLFAGCEYYTEPPADATADSAMPEGYCDDLTGSWQMVSMTVTTADSIFTLDETQTPTLKVLNESHWMFIRQSSDEFIFAQGGPYRLEDGVYTEVVAYSAEPENINQEYVFECELIDDAWYHKGDLGGMFVDEIWQRVTPTDEAM